MLIVEYFVPLAIISFAYMRIAFRLWGSKTPGAAQDQRDHNILVNKKKVIIIPFGSSKGGKRLESGCSPSS